MSQAALKLMIGIVSQAALELMIGSSPTWSDCRLSYGSMYALNGRQKMNIRDSKYCASQFCHSNMDFAKIDLHIYGSSFGWLYFGWVGSDLAGLTGSHV